MNSLVILLQILLVKFAWAQEAQVFEYSINVPPNLCSKSSEGMIKIEGADAQNLQYQWTLKMMRFTNCQRQQQRCNLMAWNSIRSIEKRIRAQNNTQTISLKNATMMNGLEYLLEVVVSNKGKSVGTKNYTFICNETAEDTAESTADNTAENTADNNADNAAENSEESPGEDTADNPAEESESERLVEVQQVLPVSLKILGSDVTYRDLTYTLTAIVENCHENCNYYHKWEMLDEVENPIFSYNVRGSELSVPSGTFKVAQSYIIRCSVVNSSNNALIDKANQKVKVLPRAVILKLSVIMLLVGSKQPFKLAAYLKDTNNFGYQTDITWQCKVNETECEDFETVNSTVLEHPGFSNIAEYAITITVTKGSMIKTATCTVAVIEYGFVKIVVDGIDNADPSKKVVIPTYVFGLVTGCALQWTSIENNSYKTIKDSVGNLNKILNVTLTEDEFLSEIDEFSAKTMDLECNLNLPAPDSWSGLLQNSSYLFRLNVTCPFSREEDEGGESSEPILIEKFLSLYADVEVTTGCLPFLRSLEVVPKEGIALKTIFNFNVDQENISYDRPVLYKFGYFLNDLLVITYSLMDNRNSSSILPYRDDGVKTIVIGCNSHLMCSEVHGPTVKTTLPEITDKDQVNLMEEFHHRVSTEDYYKAFTYALSILDTYKSLPDKQFLRDSKDFISNITSNEIKRLLMMNADGDKKWTQPGSSLLKHVGLLLNGYVSSPILLNNVVALRNELSRAKSMKLIKPRKNVNHVGRKLLMKQTSRVKRSVELFTLEEVKSYLLISEIVITTSKDKKKVDLERQNLLKQLDKYMQGLCASLYDQRQSINIELKTLVLSVEKVDRNSNSKYYHILYYENSWKLNGRTRLGECVAKIPQEDKLCLGKVALKNYFENKPIAYMAKVYSTDDDDLHQEVLNCDYTLVLPVNSAIKTREARCSLWKNKWTQLLCHTVSLSNKTIQCVCESMGYYCLEYSAKAVTTKAPVPVSTNTILAVTTERAIPVSTDSPKKPDGVNKEVELITVDPSFNLTEVIADDNATMNAHIQNEGEITLYFIIGFSIIGIAIIIFAIKRLLSEEDELQITDGPIYARLHDEHMLEDVPIL